MAVWSRPSPEWWDFALWRACRTLFFTPLPYRALSFFRRWAYDALALIPLAAAGLWWISASSGTDVPPGSVATADDFQVFLLSHHVSRFYPTLIALLLALVILRVGRTGTSSGAALKISLAVRLPVGLAAFLAVLAVFDLILVPGPILERAAPCVVAAAWAWLIRSQLYGRVRVLEPSGAGFRPPARIVFNRRARQFTRKCLTSTWRSQKTVAGVRQGLDAAVSYFAANHDTKMLAWCLARSVDYHLSISALDEAEAVVEPCGWSTGTNRRAMSVCRARVVRPCSRQ